MSKKDNQLTKRQRAVVHDLFNSQMDEMEVLAKHGLSLRIYRKWLENERFRQELEFYIEANRRQSRLIIARYAPFAAAKLVELAESSSGETSRKACMEIITADGDIKKVAGTKPLDATERPAEEQSCLSDDKMSKLLAVLAEDSAEQ
ncbi:MAG: hypothetical protein ABIG61_06260 [Planctomycetota bacterium]